jgi:hypothetical protein
VITGSPAAGHLAEPRTGWRAATADCLRRTAIAALRLAVSFAGWVGTAVLAAMHLLPWWGEFLISIPVIVAGLVIFFLPLRVDVSGRRAAVFWTCRVLAVACAFALYCVLTIAFQNLGLQEHGVVERAVVTGKSAITDDSNGAGQPYYLYSLRALSGSAIPGDLADPYGTLSIGEHVTVLAGPDFPTLDTRVSAGGQLLAGAGIAGAAAVLLAVAAWTWPRRPERA